MTLPYGYIIMKSELPIRYKRGVQNAWYISIRKATTGLKAKGNIHLAHLMLDGKLLVIGSNLYVTPEQYHECKAKDRLQAG